MNPFEEIFEGKTKGDYEVNNPFDDEDDVVDGIVNNKKEKEHVKSTKEKIDYDKSIFSTASKMELQNNAGHLSCIQTINVQKDRCVLIGSILDNNNRIVWPLALARYTANELFKKEMNPKQMTTTARTILRIFGYTIEKLFFDRFGRHIILSVISTDNMNEKTSLAYIHFDQTCEPFQILKLNIQLRENESIRSLSFVQPIEETLRRNRNEIILILFSTTYGDLYETYLRIEQREKKFIGTLNNTRRIFSLNYLNKNDSVLLSSSRRTSSTRTIINDEMINYQIEEINFILLKESASITSNNKMASSNDSINYFFVIFFATPNRLYHFFERNINRFTISYVTLKKVFSQTSLEDMNVQYFRSIFSNWSTFNSVKSIEHKLLQVPYFIEVPLGMNDQQFHRTSPVQQRQQCQHSSDELNVCKLSIYDGETEPFAIRDISRIAWLTKHVVVVNRFHRSFQKIVDNDNGVFKNKEFYSHCTLIAASKRFDSVQSKVFDQNQLKSLSLDDDGIYEPLHLSLTPFCLIVAYDSQPYVVAMSDINGISGTKSIYYQFDHEILQWIANRSMNHPSNESSLSSLSNTNLSTSTTTTTTLPRTATLLARRRLNCMQIMKYNRNDSLTEKKLICFFPSLGFFSIRIINDSSSAWKLYGENEQFTIALQLTSLLFNDYITSHHDNISSINNDLSQSASKVVNEATSHLQTLYMRSLIHRITNDKSLITTLEADSNLLNNLAISLACNNLTFCESYNQLKRLQQSSNKKYESLLKNVELKFLCERLLRMIDVVKPDITTPYQILIYLIIDKYLEMYKDMSFNEQLFEQLLKFMNSRKKILEILNVNIKMVYSIFDGMQLKKEKKKFIEIVLKDYDKVFQLNLIDNDYKSCIDIVQYHSDLLYNHFDILFIKEPVNFIDTIQKIDEKLNMDKIIFSLSSLIDIYSNEVYIEQFIKLLEYIIYDKQLTSQFIHHQYLLLLSKKTNESMVKIQQYFHKSSNKKIYFDIDYVIQLFDESVKNSILIKLYEMKKDYENLLKQYLLLPIEEKNARKLTEKLLSSNDLSIEEKSSIFSIFANYLAKYRHNELQQYYEKYQESLSDDIFLRIDHLLPKNRTTMEHYSPIIIPFLDKCQNEMKEQHNLCKSLRNQVRNTGETREGISLNGLHRCSVCEKRLMNGKQFTVFPSCSHHVHRDCLELKENNNLVITCPLCSNRAVDRLDHLIYSNDNGNQLRSDMAEWS
ncbi:hypothetical protein SNEBB_000084 [Seison nebaliae]|nr:hypothetical protein SNEBB_000084 [Seison nebaliae]